MKVCLHSYSCHLKSFSRQYSFSTETPIEFFHNCPMCEPFLKKKEKKKQEIKFYLGKNTVTTRKFVLAPYENSLSGIHLNFRPRLCKKALTVPQISHNYISRRVFDAWDSSFALYAPLFLFNALGFILFLAVTRILKRDSRDSRPFHRRELDVLNGIFW